MKIEKDSSNLLAWCAGLFDADGCFTMYWEHNPKSAQYPYLKRVATLEMRDETAIDIFQRLFGGSKRLNKARYENHSNTFVWRASGASLDLFLSRIESHLILKRPQAKLILESLTIRRNTTRKITEEEFFQLKSYKERMNEINRKGIGK